MTFQHSGINMKSKWKVGFTMKGAFTSCGTHPNLTLVIHNTCNSIEDISSKYPMVFGIYG